MQAVNEGARSIWDEYRLLGELFRGPATVAWRAEHVISGRPARLTTVHAPPMASSVTTEAISHAFRRAAEQAREFSHPDSLPIIGIAEQAGLPVAVTMLPAGALLSERLSERPVPLGAAMKQVSQIAHAVAALHGLTPAGPSRPGQRHGYLIPENLWVREDGRVALLDSGLHAAAAHAAFSSGFPLAPSAYVPPGDDAFAPENQEADLYALVALLMRWVTGRAALPGGLPEAVAALPDLLPASLRAELAQAAAGSGGGSRPDARALAIHLAFDATWIHARERSERESHLVEGELLDAARATERPPMSSPVEDSPLRRWARAYPAAGVRGGAAAPASGGGWASVAAAGQRVIEGVSRLVPRAPSLDADDGTSSESGECAVQLGPYATAEAAGGVRARLRGAWPAAAVMRDGDEHFVRVTTCASRRRAEELVERFRSDGDPAEVKAR